MEYKFIENYRLNYIKSKMPDKVNWLFLPGGPGMGSEYLIDFVTKLNIEGQKIVGDFPGDGSNRNLTIIDYNIWRKGLLTVIKDLKPCILVTHSFSGMFTLTIPEIEMLIHGLILISSAPDQGWMLELASFVKKRYLPDVGKELAQFYINQTDDNLKKIFIATRDYLFVKDEIPAGDALLNNSPFNAKSRIWADLNFHLTYEHKWVPKELPTLIIGSEDDHLLPVHLMVKKKEFHRSNIEFLILKNTGHFPWLSKFDEIEKSLINMARKISIG